MAEQPLTRDELAAALRGLSVRYWDSHRFHVRLHAGGCTPEEVRTWVANRWYYQSRMAQKNAAVVVNCQLPQVRRQWLDRISFHDGDVRDDWLALADAVGLAREEMLDGRYALRGTRFAVDGYLHFCQSHTWLEGAAAALTELFAPELMAARVAAWRRHYDWIKPDGFAYFETRIPIVRHDSEYTLDLVLNHAQEAHLQRAAIAALEFKCDVLNAILDAVDYAGITA